ncbi:MAG: serine/threonine-protein kinase [Planctomycetota bacterium]
MEKARFARLEALFQMAADTPPELRADLLARACPHDPALQHEVLDLLAADRGSSFLAAVGPATFGPAADDPEPRSLPGYRIVRRLGAGGMGRVYEAEQLEPRRSVAVKVLRQMAEPARARLRREAEMQARLQHRHIAQVYVADTFGEVPYLVMELVAGDRLDAWVAQRRPARAVCIDLLLQVCAAVEHAHQRGIVHRDLKPANVMVDADGSVKVLDFGIAAAIESTEKVRPAGTLGYMSPEQLCGEPGASDTRADVYSLGVIAYELLAGRAPFASIAERGDCADVGTGGAPLLGRLDPSLRGDLEAIVACAMASDPDERYPAVASLAADLRRVLRREPVSVRPASLGYVAARFAQRHRGTVVAASLGVTALIGGLTASLLLLSRAHAAESEARAARAQAESEADVAREHADLLEGVFAAPNHNRGALVPGQRAADTKVVDVLDAAAERLIADPPRPATELFVRTLLGGTYLSLDLTDKAVEQLDRAARLEPGAVRGGWQKKVAALGLLAMAQGKRQQHDEALAAAERALAHAHAPGGAEEEAARAFLARAFSRSGRAARAPSAAAEEPPATTVMMALEQIRQVARAGSGADALERLEQLRPRVVALPLAAGARIDFVTVEGDLLMDMGRQAEAAARFASYHEELVRELGPAHGRSLEFGNRVAQAWFRLGWFARARRLVESAVAAAREARTDVARPLGFLLRTLATLDIADYRPQQACDRVDECLRLLREQSADEHSRPVLEQRQAHAHYAWLAGHVDEACRELEAVCADFDVGFPPNQGVEAHKLLGLVLAELGRVDPAVEHFRLTLDNGAEPSPPQVVAEIRFALEASAQPQAAAAFPFPPQVRTGRRSGMQMPATALLSLQRYVERGHAAQVAAALDRRVERGMTGPHLAFAQVVRANAQAACGRLEAARASLAAAEEVLTRADAHCPERLAQAMADLRARL